MEQKLNQHFWRKLHSLSGIIPIGLFLTVHLFVNYTAAYGEGSYNKAASIMVNLPFKFLLETFIIFLPLYFHAIYGVFIAFQAKNNSGQYKFLNNWKFMLQRLTGIITFIFVTWHIWQTKVQVEFGGVEANFDLMANIVGNKLYLALYMIGIVSATYHFANGIWTFLITWGITISPKSQKIFHFVAIGVFLALTYIGLRAIWAFV